MLNTYRNGYEKPKKYIYVTLTQSDEQHTAIRYDFDSYT